MRDGLKNQEYFKNYVRQGYNRLNKRYEKLANGLIKREREKIVKRKMGSAYKQIIIAKYSQGDDMFSVDVYNDFKKMLTLMYNNWEENASKFKYSKDWNLPPEVQIRKKSEVVILDQYTFSNYAGILETVALGILLNVPDQDIKLLANYIDRDNVKDFLFEFLLDYRLKNRPKIESESYREYFHVNERFFRLKEIINIEEKNTAQKEMKAFLEKDWENAFSGTPFFEAHKSPHDIYVGYWCFVAAAIVKIKGLDESTFRDNKYYPKDLVNTQN